MSRCCKPLVKVTASTLSASSLTLTIDRAFSSLGRNSNFCLCIPFGFIPNQDSALALPVLIADTAGGSGNILPATLVCTGNNLHLDSLRTFFLRNVCKACTDRTSCCGPRQINGCCTFTFNVFYGFDDPHITFCHKMCPSIFGTAAIPSDDVVLTNDIISSQ